MLRGFILEGLSLQRDFYKGKRVLVTGHTGFKGAWLSLWLSMLGADVTGLALEPEAGCLFEQLEKIDGVTNIYEDIRNLDVVEKAVQTIKPDIILHLAAFSFLKKAHNDPVTAFTTNVQGGVNLLEAVRQSGGVKSVVFVTTDKVYQNRGLERGYTEEDMLGGGLEVYSGSKACLEIAVESYRNAYFQPEKYEEHKTAIATARASNVLGGGDHIKSRIVPGILHSLSVNERIVIRNPQAVRPWQNILDALCGYLTLAQNLYIDGPKFSGAWNFGPYENGIQTVGKLVQGFEKSWGGSSACCISDEAPVREAGILKLDITKSVGNLGWKPLRSLDMTIDETVYFYKKSMLGINSRELCRGQIEKYMDDLFNQNC